MWRSGPYWRLITFEILRTGSEKMQPNVLPQLYLWREAATLRVTNIELETCIHCCVTAT